MMKKRRLFWSYDAEKTEQWLTENAQQGWKLSGLNRWTRQFRFEEGGAEELVYRIAFNKNKGKQLPSSLKEEGWEEGVTTGPWQIAVNRREVETIHLKPSREGLIRHNRFVMLVFFSLVFYFGGMLLANASMVLSSFMQDGSLNVEPSPLWAVTYTLLGVVILTLILGIYSIVKIKKANAAMEKPPLDVPLQQGHPPRKMAKRLKVGWMYAPDRLEEWLESQEQKGLHLTYVNKIGSMFSFVESSPRKYCYHADHQSNPPESYFSLHREAGWEPVFNSLSGLDKWVLWRKEWIEGEERPVFFSDLATKKRQAKRLALMYSVLFAPMVLIYLFNLNSVMRYGGVSWSAGIQAFAFLVFLSFVLRIWFYYFRVKRAVLL